MTDRYNSESLRTDINEKLSAYSKSAGSFRKTSRGSSVSRTLMYGSLAAVVPLAAATGDAGAQCLSNDGTHVLIPNADYRLTISMGGYDYLRLRLDNFGGLRANTGNPSPFSMFGDKYLFQGFSRTFAFNSASSSTVTPNPSNLLPRAYLCMDENSATAGRFCNSSGFIVLKRTLAPEFGWIGLGVTYHKTGSSVDSVTVSVGPRGMQAVAQPTVHPGDCASLEAPLPVELVSFNAIFDMTGVALSWETASELNNAGFELQRASGTEAFRKIAFVEGKGTTTDAQSYRFRDEDTQPNTHYKYRLKQIDLDGTTSFSEIVELFTEDPSQIALSEFYPNPAATGRAKLEIKVADAVEATVEIYDVRGALVESRSKMLNAGQNELAFRTNGLAAGTHFAKVKIGERVLYRQFVVAK